MAKFTEKDWMEIIAATHAGMSIDEFETLVADWLPTAPNPVFKRLYTEFVYQPMLEVMTYLRANDFRTYIVSGGGQEFVRAYAERGLRHPAGAGHRLSIVTNTDDRTASPSDAEPKLCFIDDNAGKAEDQLFIGKRPQLAFGNSTATADAGVDQRRRARPPGVLVSHDDAEREYAYGPADGLPDTHVGTFTQALMDEANQHGWSVISMKNDWKPIFP